MADTSNNSLLASFGPRASHRSANGRALEAARGTTIRPLFWHAVMFIVVAASLLLDIILPRGATAAIGYAIVPVLAAVHRSTRFVLLMTALCTVLTWTGYLLEPAGVHWWF